jgi:putative exosortase-associated protein (TIGR04073 family)
MINSEGLRLFLFLAMLSSVAMPQVSANPFKKLGRGITNVVTAPAELLLQPIRVAKVDEEPQKAVIGGVLQGVYYTFLRLGSGVYDIFTFPMTEGAGGASIIEPETVFEGFDAVTHTKWDYPAMGMETGPYQKKKPIPFHKKRPPLSYPSQSVPSQ